MTFPSAANQPPWIPYCLKEIESRAKMLTNWEFQFLSKIRPKVNFSQFMNEWELTKLRQIHTAVYRRKVKPQEKEPSNNHRGPYQRRRSHF